MALRLGPAAHEAYMTAAQTLTAEAEARAEARGEARAKAELLLRQLGLRFGALTAATRERVLHAPSERLAAQTLEEVLA